jgi:hypothetical protein
MILNIILVILFILIFVFAAYFKAFLENRSAAMNSTNSFYHVNQNTPIGFSSENGIAGGYQDSLNNGARQTSEDYDENMDSGTFTRSKQLPPQDQEPSTCLDTIDEAHASADGGGVWDQMGCDEWWNENMPMALMTLVGVIMQVTMFLKQIRARQSAAEFLYIRKKMTQLNLKDANGRIIRDINDLTPDELNDVLKDSRNSSAVTQFQNLYENDPKFQKYADKNFKITNIPKTALLSINDFQSEFGQDFRNILKDRMPNVDVDRLSGDPRARIPVSMQIKQYDNIDIDSSAIRTRNRPGLSFADNAEADFKRKAILDDININFKNIKTVDDVHFLTNLNTTDYTPDQLEKIRTDFGIKPTLDINEVKGRFNEYLNEFQRNNVYPSFQTFSDDNLPTSVGSTTNMDELKSKYNELFSEELETKPFKGTSSIADMIKHENFNASTDIDFFKRKGMMSPNIINYFDGDEMKYASIELEPHKMVAVDGLADSDINMGNERLRKIAAKKVSPEEFSKFRNISRDLNAFRATIEVNPNIKNKSILANVSKMDPRLFRELQDLDVIPDTYVKTSTGKISMAEVDSNISVDREVKVGKFSDKFDDGRIFSKAGLSELKSNLKTSVGIGAGLGIAMGLASTDFDDEDAANDFLFETSAMVIGTALAEVAEYAVERTLNGVGRYLSRKVGNTALAKSLSKALSNASERLAQKGFTKSLAKTAGKELAKETGEKVAKGALRKAGSSVAKGLGKVAAKTGLKTLGKAAMSGLSKLAAGPVGAVLLVIDVVGLILDLIDPCGFESKIKLRDQWEGEFQQYDAIHREILKSMGKSYPGEAKPELLRYYTEYNPLDGTARQVMNKQDKKEYDRYYNSYFEKCNLITDASCRDNTFSSMALNSIRQGRMQVVSNLDTNMLNPYSIQPVITDSMRVGDSSAYSRMAISSNLQTISAMLSTTQNLVDGRLVTVTERIKSDKIELKPLKKLLSEEMNSKAILYYIVAFLTMVISIVLTIKLF